MLDLLVVRLTWRYDGMIAGGNGMMDSAVEGVEIELCQIKS